MRSSIGWLIAARVVSGAGVGFVTGMASAALAELQPGGCGGHFWHLRHRTCRFRGCQRGTRTAPQR